MLSTLRDHYRALVVVLAPYLLAALFPGCGCAAYGGDPSQSCVRVNAKGRAMSWGGSGTVVEAGGKRYVISCRHVCPDGNAVYSVTLPDGSTRSVSFVAADGGADLAVLAAPEGLAPVPVADEPPAPGTPTRQWGYPGGKRTPKAGQVIGYTGGLVPNPRGGYFRDFDVGAQSNPGDSGCGVFDPQDRLVAVVWGKDLGPTGTGREHCVGVPDVRRFLAGVSGSPGQPQPQPKAEPPKVQPNCPGGVCPPVQPAPRRGFFRRW